MEKLVIGQIMKFGDMPDGTHFEELGGNGRKFIKLQSKTAAGIPNGYIRTFPNVAPRTDQYQLNSVDYDGIGGLCPAWLEFRVIQKPK